MTWALLGLLATDTIAQTTVESRVPTSHSDVVEGYDDEDVSRTGNALEMGPEEWAGVRFSNVAIPSGSTITNAYLEFTSSNSENNDADFKIYGYDTDNAGEWSGDDGSISYRPKTNAYVDWINVESWTTGNTYQTPDLKAIVQEIVDRGGWSPGNGLALIIHTENPSGDRYADSYDQNPATAPLLHIEYTGPPGTTYYVRTDGNDSNTGLGTSASEAWATVAAAVDKNELDPGDIIYVMPGTYSGIITPSIDGASGAPIKFVADKDGTIFGTEGDVILTSTAYTVLEINLDQYFEFDGFTITGSTDAAVYINNSTGTVLTRCVISAAADSNVYIEGSSTVELVNCIIRDSGKHGVFTDDNTTVAIWNCTIVDNGEDGVHTHSPSVVTVANSIIADNAEDGLQQHSGTLMHDYNLVYDNGGSNFSGTSQASNEIVADPLFTDAANHDYTLTSASPAIDVGTDATGIVDEDFLGYYRPIGLGWELGCYEYILLGDWQLETGSGTTATDTSGNGNDGTLQVSTGWEAARCGQSITLNGTSDWVDLGEVNLGEQGYTVSVWFKSEAVGQQTIFAATGTSGTNHLMYLELTTFGIVQFVHRSPIASSGGTTLASSESFHDGYWHHVAAVKSDTDLRLYIDGELIDTMSDTTEVHSSVDVVLGRFGAGLSERYFNGSLDDVRLYGAAMSDSEVAQLFGLMGRWRLDETTGTTAIDSSVLGNSGTLNGGFTFDSNSKASARVGAGLIFDGTDDHISIPNAPELQITDAITISAWIKGDAWDSGDSADTILRKGDGSPNNYQLAISGGQATIYLDDTDAAGYRGDTVLDTDTWYHVTGTWDGTSAIVYVNGVMDHASAYAHSAPIGTDTRDLYIGGRALYDLFDGTLDDIRLYNRALCADEILELYSSGNFGLRIIKWIEVR